MLHRRLLLLVALAAGAAAQEKPLETYTTASGVKVEVLRAGKAGTEPAPGEKVRIHYTGRLVDGTKFDSSLDRGRPLEFVAGRRRLPVRGLDEGVLLMTVGSRYRFTVPPKLGYLRRRPPNVPEDATLVFDVELLAIPTPPPFPKAKPDQQKKTATGLVYEVRRTGEGARPRPDQGVKMRFAVWTSDGRLVTCTETEGAHVAGAIELLRLTRMKEKFLREAALLMRPGTILRLEVPPDLCWGKQRVGVVDPNTMTVWELELLAINDVPAFAPLDESAMQRTASGLRYEVLKKGTGRQPARTDRVQVHYTGWLQTGKLFDSSHGRGEPTTFPLARVIPGWTEGLQLMKEGAVYRFVVPPMLGYGDAKDPMGLIPANSTLVFLVELIRVG